MPWAEGEAIKAAEFALQQWITGRGGNEAAEEITAVRAVQLFIEKYGDSRFEDLGFPDGKVIPNRAGWRRGKGEDQIWMVLPQVWRTEVCAGMDPTMVAKVLCERGMLDRSEKSYQKSQRVGPKDGDVARCYTVTANVLYDETDVTDVTDVTPPETKGFSHSDPEGVTPEKSNKTGPVTPVTHVTHDLSSKAVCADSAPVCAQCNAPGDLQSHPNGAGTVLLHEECVRFWRDRFWKKPDADLDIPDFLDRRGES